MSSSEKHFKTLPEMIQYTFDNYRNTHLFNYKEDDRWKHMSTETFLEQIRKLSLGLKSLGLKKGDSVGILTIPSPFWLIADFATTISGGVSVPFFVNDSEENFKFKIKDAKIKFLFVSTDGSKDLNEVFLKTTQPNLKFFRNIIIRNIPLTGKNIMDYETLLLKGAEIQKKEPELYAKLQAESGEEDMVTIIYTSGSTGTPKGVELTNKNFVSQILAVESLFSLNPIDDHILSCLPLAHSFERMVMYFYISRGVSIHFADDVKNIGPLLKSINPALMTVVPRLLEKVYSKMKTKIKEGSFLKRIIGSWAINRAMKESSPTGHPVSSLDINKKKKNFLADFLVYSKMRKAFGEKLRYLITGGAAMPVDLHRFFDNIGILLYPGYGLTETSPVLSVNCPGHHKIGTVGQAIPGVKLKIAHNGEILAQGPNIMRGYHNKPKETKERIDPEGWLHTGDLGKIDDEGYLTITGRIKEMCKTSTGKYVCPVPLEQALCKFHLIDMAIVIAEGKKFASCLLFIDPAYVEPFKKYKGYEHLSIEKFLKCNYVKEKMTALLEKVNCGLNHWEQIQEYRFIIELPSVERGELTPTMKLRRHVINRKYGDLIKEIYAEEEEEKDI